MTTHKDKWDAEKSITAVIILMNSETVTGLICFYKTINSQVSYTINYS